MGFERQNGTLEIVFLSPANRIALIYGRALGALFESIWMFTVFCVLTVLFTKGIPIKNIIYFPACFAILVISAVVWGGLMNVIFLFSRDASILFNIFDEPMSLFSGVRVPVSVFPFWAKVISAVFPLTHSLVAVRSLLLDGYVQSGLTNYIYLLLSMLIMIVLTLFLLKKAENHGRKTGNFTFY